MLVVLCLGFPFKNRKQLQTPACLCCAIHDLYIEPPSPFVPRRPRTANVVCLRVEATPSTSSQAAQNGDVGPRWRVRSTTLARRVDESPQWCWPVQRGREGQGGTQAYAARAEGEGEGEVASKETAGCEGAEHGPNPNVVKAVRFVPPLADHPRWKHAQG